jgi:hypothetical protein
VRKSKSAVHIQPGVKAGQHTAGAERVNCPWSHQSDAPLPEVCLPFKLDSCMNPVCMRGQGLGVTMGRLRGGKGHLPVQGMPRADGAPAAGGALQLPDRFARRSKRHTELTYQRNPCSAQQYNPTRTPQRSITLAELGSSRQSSATRAHHCARKALHGYLAARVLGSSWQALLPIPISATGAVGSVWPVLCPPALPPGGASIQGVIMLELQASMDA